MGTIIIDKTGEADLSFHSVPLHAVKKATFTTKLGVVNTLMKMMWNGVTYNFSETAQNGAVLFSNNYENWEFVAPDNRLDFAKYEDMTIGSVLADIKTRLTANPIPAWDKFAEWLNRKDYLVSSVLQGVNNTYLVNGNAIETTINNIKLDNLTCFMDLLDAIITSVSPASNQMIRNYSYNNGFRCTFRLVSSYRTLDMSFIFRE